MKTKTWIVLLSALLVLCLGLSLFLLRPQKDAAFARITSQGTLLKVVDLRIDQEFTVTTAEGGFNTVTVRSGAIAVTAASCPDRYCMKRGFCSGGAQIVCLPNRLTITFLGEQEIDAAVG